MKKNYVKPETQMMLLLGKEDILLTSSNGGNAMEDEFSNMFQ